MQTVYHTLFGTADPFDILALISASALKGLIILGVAAAACILLRGASASVRHLCWLLALAALLVLPILSIVTPGVPVAVIPSGLIEGMGGAAPVLAPPVRSPVSDPVTAPAPQAIVTPEPGSTAAAAPVAPSVDAAGRATSARDATLPSMAGQILPWLIIMWMTGAAFVLLRLAFGTARARRLVKSGVLVQSARMLDEFERVRRALGVRRNVRMLISDAATIPLTVGTLHPTLVLPGEATSWPQARIRCVLAHELAHVRRLDYLAQTAAALACALHWFNPFVWKAAKAMRAEAEMACDDAVITHSSTRASAYAMHLIEIARGLPSAGTVPAVAVAMARRSQLEGRVLSILEDKRSRSASRITLSTVLAAGFMVLMPLILVRPAISEEIGSEPTVAGAASTKWSVKVPESASVSGIATKTEEVSGASAAAMESDVIRRSFRVSPGGLLRLETDRGNIQIRTSSRNAVEVEVRREARGRASEEDFQVEFRQDGDRIVIDGTSERNRWGSDGLSIDFVIEVPEQFNLDLETAGGNISVDDLNGTVKASTAGGNLSFGAITGSIRASTAGGNVSLKDNDGDVTVRTAGGNVSIGGAAGDLRVNTAGGNIHAEAIRGTAELNTAGGQISARLDEQPQGSWELSSSGGEITVDLADGIQVDLDAQTMGGHVVTDFDVTIRGTVRPGSLTGTINGGGPNLSLKTAAGDIRIRRR